MKLKNRKGSTLALTLMVFAVLMIFATFILSFMVTENKQAMYHQNKTQAYYLARSGAEVVEASIKKQFALDKNTLVSSLNNLSGKVINVENNDGLKIAEVKLSKDIDPDPSKPIKDESGNDINNYIVLITSEGNKNNVKQLVNKELPITIKETTKSSPIDKPIIFFDSAPDIMKIVHDGKNANHPGKPILAYEGNPSDYGDLNFPFKDENEIPSFSKVDSTYKTIDFTSTPIVINEGDYKLPGSIDLSNKNITINGKVNIYVEKSVLLSNTDIVYANNMSQLNLFIYGEDDKYSLYTTEKAIGNFQGNIYVNKGNIKFDVLEFKFEGNIITNGKKIELLPLSNANIDEEALEKAKIIFNGLIYGKNADVFIGDGIDNSSKTGAILLKGNILANKIIYNEKEQHYLAKLVFELSTGIKDDQLYGNILEITTIGTGRFK